MWFILTRRECVDLVSLFAFNELQSRLAKWKSRPKCAPTAEIFGNFPDYLELTDPSPLSEGDHDDDGDVQVILVHDALNPPKKRGRELQESGGVRSRPSQNPTIGPSNPRRNATLRPEGTMRCLWGDGCAFEMAYDYKLTTIKAWKGHIVSHLKTPNPSSKDARGQAKTVECSWGECNARVPKGYLFKHIVTHEVRLKLSCPHGCGVAIRDDNLGRHLKSCIIYNGRVIEDEDEGEGD